MAAPRGAAIVVLGPKPLFVSKLNACRNWFNRCDVGNNLRAIFDSRNKEYDVAICLIPRRVKFDNEEVVGNVALVERAERVTIEVATRSL